ncbi:hypothetical protein OC834_000785 [Tilletia horrida]|uniref:Uncharacterized protein n=1 Tax=Tilletia horrida TaxID=155126 RepID=A0AAN6GES7_9BASI|nr:hypothetical protein OC834_000785 [Tilletia horrida]KAK0537605.1 hypothetical protein OC842_001570 [Tilletia horrida]
MARPQYHSYMPPQAPYPPRWHDERPPLPQQQQWSTRRDESMGPPRELPRHRSVSRLTDAWRSTAGSPMPASAFGSPGPSSAGYAMGPPGPGMASAQMHARMPHAFQQPYLAQTPLRYATPSLTAGPSATPGSWANGSARMMADRHPSIVPAYEPYQQAQQYYRGESVDMYGEYAKPPSAPRSSSIGPWLRAAHGSSSRGRSGSVRSSQAPPGPEYAQVGPPRPFARYSPAYIRPSSSFLGSGRPPVDPYAQAAFAASSRAYSELPGARGFPAYLIPGSHTPAPTQHSGVRNFGSAPSAFRGPSNRALSYIRQATESATAAGSPVVRSRRAPVSSHRPESPRAGTPKTEPSSTPAPGLLFDPDETQDEAEVEPVEQQISPSAAEGVEDGWEAAEDADAEDDEEEEEVQELVDFDDEDESVNIAQSTAVTVNPKKSSPAKLTTSPVKRAPSPNKSHARTQRQRAKGQPSEVAAATPAQSSAQQAPKLRRLSNWFIFTQKTRKLPKDIANKMRSSPFSRILGTDDFARSEMWIRVGAQLDKEEIMQMVKGQDVVPSDYTWETSLVTRARRASEDEGGGAERGTIIVSTSSGAEYALDGPMNVGLAAERSALGVDFWQEFEDTGGLGEEGWEALILRALLHQSPLRQPQSDAQSQVRVQPESRNTPSRNHKHPPAQGTRRRSEPKPAPVPTEKKAAEEQTKPSASSSRKGPAPLQASKLFKRPQSSSSPTKPTKRRKSNEQTTQGVSPKRPIPRTGRGSRDIAGLVSSPFGTPLAVRQALQELGMYANSDSEDELSQTPPMEHPYFTRRKGPEDPDPIRPAKVGRRAPAFHPSAVTNLREQPLPGELSDVSDSADEYIDNPRARSSGDSHSDASSDDGRRPRQNRHSVSNAKKARFEEEDERDGVGALKRSKRKRTPASARKWWEVDHPARSTTKAVPRAIVQANRRSVGSTPLKRRKTS